MAPPASIADTETGAPLKHGADVRIDTEAYAHNLRVIKALAAPARLCAVLKGDAYGHGLELLAKVAATAGADYLGIVENWEAAVIRRLGITLPVMRLRPATSDEVQEAAAWDVEEMVGSFDEATAVAAVGRSLGRPIPVHLDFDVGMGRTGFLVQDNAECLDVDKALLLDGLRVVGLMTHYPVADEDAERTRAQHDCFERFVTSHAQLNALRTEGKVICHTANSAATLAAPHTHQDLIRVGLASYGVAPSADLPPVLLKPVMSWHSRIATVRKLPAGRTIGYGMDYVTEGVQRIATLPLGYADGLPWASKKSGAEVLVGGKRCPILGRISMNMITIDVTHLPEVHAGNPVVLLGRQGDEEIRVETIAAQAGTIAYEVCCMVGRQAHRRATK